MPKGIYEHKPENSINLLTIMKNERGIKRAVELYNRNPAVYPAIRAIRRGESLQGVVDYVKKLIPNADISRSGVQTWITEIEGLKKWNNNVYSEFMQRAGIDIKENHKQLNKEALKKYNSKFIAGRKVSSIKRKILEEEYNKAKVLLGEFDLVDLPMTKKWELYGISRRQMNRITQEIQNGAISPKISARDLYDLNCQILSKGSKMILDNLDTINPKHFQDLKALSDILNTSFKQNRLIDGQSTENISIGIHDIYDKIIQSADNRNKISSGKKKIILEVNPKKDE